MALDPARGGRDAGRIAEEVISHLAGLVGAEVAVTLETTGRVPDGVPEKVVRIVTENCRTLKFTNQGFETELRQEAVTPPGTRTRRGSSAELVVRWMSVMDAAQDGR